MACLGNFASKSLKKLLIKVLAGAAILSEGSTERESIPKLIHMVVGMIQSFQAIGLRALLLYCLLIGGITLSSLPRGCLHRAAYNVASGFQHSEQTREQEKSHCLFIA